MFIFYGTQTGTCRRYATRLSSHLTCHRRLANTVHDLVSFAQPQDFVDLVKSHAPGVDAEAAEIEKEKPPVVFIFIVSTHGLGVPPHSCEPLQKLLQSKHDFLNDVETNLSTKCKFSVLALGDKKHLHFCTFGYEIDNTLFSYGNERRLMEIGILDRDITPGEYERDFIEWREKLVAKVSPLKLQQIDPIEAIVNAEKRLNISRTDSRKSLEIKNLDRIDKFLNNEVSDAKVEVMENINPDVYKILLRLDEKVVFSPAGTLRVFPKNKPEMVDQVITKLRLDPIEPIELCEQDKKVVVTVKDLFLYYFDLNCGPDADLLEVLKMFSPNAGIDFTQNYPKTISSALMNLDDGDLESENAVKDLNVLLVLLPQINFREYTIANCVESQHEQKDDTVVELCTRVLLDITHRPWRPNKGEKITGLSSAHFLRSYFEKENGKDVQFQVSFTDSIFTKMESFLSCDSTMTKQLILATNGTGITLTKSVLEHLIRVCEKANTGRRRTYFKVLVFMGHRSTNDYIYEKFMKTVVKEGKNVGLEIMNFVALSQMGNKMYVQKLLEMKKTLVVSMLKRGKESSKFTAPYVALSGSTSMIRGTNKVFQSILGKDLFDQMNKDYKYLVEPYNK